jgi:hypothetical protein
MTERDASRTSTATRATSRATPAPLPPRLPNKGNPFFDVIKCTPRPLSRMPSVCQVFANCLPIVCQVPPGAAGGAGGFGWRVHGARRAVQNALGVCKAQCRQVSQARQAGHITTSWDGSNAQRVIFQRPSGRVITRWDEARSALYGGKTCHVGVRARPRLPTCNPCMAPPPRAIMAEWSLVKVVLHADKAKEPAMYQVAAYVGSGNDKAVCIF